MAYQQWSDRIMVVELGDAPQFNEELYALSEALQSKACHVVLNFAAVSFIDSSNVSRLLRLRKLAMSKGCRVILCDVSTQVWGVLLVLGLDKIFEFTNDMATALATLQLDEGKGRKKG